MKQFSLLLLAVVLFSCGQKSKPVSLPAPPPPLKFFVSGTYVAFSKSAYCRTWDTLSVLKDRRQANVYRIARLTTFQRNLENNYYSAERHQSFWMATYDPSATLMKGLDEAPDLLFQPKDNAVLLADHVFIKIE